MGGAEVRTPKEEDQGLLSKRMEVKDKGPHSRAPRASLFFIS